MITTPPYINLTGQVPKSTVIIASSPTKLDVMWNLLLVLLNNNTRDTCYSPKTHMSERAVKVIVLKRVLENNSS